MNFRKKIILSAAAVIIAGSGIQARNLTLTTSDGKKISASLSIPADLKGKVPAVILIHQGGSDRSEWKWLIPRLTGKQYIVLAYDIRGHGKSDSVSSRRSLYNDPRQAPKDLLAAVKYLKKLKTVDSRRIAIIGSSIGGNLAMAASSRGLIKTVAAISCKTSAVKNLSGKQKVSFQSAMIISSARDQNGKRARWARELYNMTISPKNLVIVKESASHGVSIFKDDPSLTDKVLQWLKQTL